MIDEEQYSLLLAVNDAEDRELNKVKGKWMEKGQDSVLKEIQDYFSSTREDGLLFRDNGNYRIIETSINKQLLNSYHDILHDINLKKIRIVTIWDTDYPEKLSRIKSPPMIFFLRGELPQETKNIAIVGSRKSSEKGLAITREFTRYHAQKGRCIVSGLALGVDTVAHEEAIASGGVTIAVLPGAVDDIIPKSNTSLADTIISNGALISEVTRLKTIHRGRYIERNRITSGISDALIVIETAVGGGSFRQAGFAKDQGIPLYVVDHGQFERDESRTGFEKLVEQGGIPISSPEEVEV